MSWWRFFFWNALGGIVWATAVGLLAYYAGRAVADTVARYGVYGGIARRDPLRPRHRRASRLASPRGARREVLHRSRRDDADRCGACRVRRRPGPCARPRGRGRLREQGDEQCARQSRRSDVQRVRAALRAADALLRRHAPEPAELPRSRLGIDPRDHLRLHDLHRRVPRTSPTRSRRPGRPGRHTPRDFPLRASLAARTGATRRSTTPSRTSGTSPGIRAGGRRSSRCHGSPRIFAQAPCRTSRSSSRISATRCTTARSPSATPGSAERSPRCCGCRELQSSSCSTKEALLCAAAATRLPSSSAPPYARARLSRASRITTAHLRTIEQAPRSSAPRPVGRSETDHGHLALAQPAGKPPVAWNSIRPMLTALAAALAARDPSTAAHCARVTLLAARVAVWMGWDDRPAPDTGARRSAARPRQGDDLRDDPRKRGPLAPDEVAEIRKHPAAGARLIGPVGPLRKRCPTCCTTTSAGTAAAIPPGAPARKFPKEARLLAVADAFDAMTSTRPYRRALPIAARARRGGALRRHAVRPEVARRLSRGLERRCAQPPPQPRRSLERRPDFELRRASAGSPRR